MSNDDKYAQLMQHQSTIITDIMMRITALERILIQKNVFTEEEFQNHLNIVKDELLELVSKTLKDNTN